MAIDSLVRAARSSVGLLALVGGAVAMAVIAVESVDAENQRPAYRQVAHYLDRVAGNSPVVEFHLALSADTRLHQSGLSFYFKRRHPLFNYGEDDRGAWARAVQGRDVWYVQPMQPAWLHYTGYDKAPAVLRARLAELGGPDGRAIESASKRFPGFYPIVVRRYSGVATGRLEHANGVEVISWTFGKRVTVSPSVAVGGIDLMTPSNGPLLTAGWALTANTHRSVDWFLFFSNNQLFAVSAGGSPSKAAAQATKARSQPLAGFGLAMKQAPADHAAIKVFAVVGDRATELHLTQSGVRSLQQR